MTSNSTTVEDILAQKRGTLRDIIDVNEKTLKLVIFTLGSEAYAFYGHSISEILPKGVPIFFIPGCPSSLLGVINLRGEIESVIHIGSVLKLSHETSSTDGTLLLGHCPAMRSALYVDNVLDVVDVPESEIQTPPETLPEHLKPYVAGLVIFQERTITVLNLDPLLTDYRQGLG